MSETINHNEVYDRIINGKPYGKNLKPYPKKIIKAIIEEFIEEGEFEKCVKLEEFISNKFDHQKNYNSI